MRPKPRSHPIAWLAGSALAAVIIIAGAWFFSPAEPPGNADTDDPARASADRVTSGGLGTGGHRAPESADWDFWVVLVSAGVISGLLLAVWLKPSKKRTGDASRVGGIFE